MSKSQGVLQALYADLASPGLRQVGKALETVLKTGNILLLPIRMLNEYAAAFERENFAAIADRFSKIPEDDIVDVRPEIGVPILEKLSITHDPDLRKLFIELLASAADKKKVGLAHPSFVRVIESLSPDEALLLKGWKTLPLSPCLAIFRMAADGASSTVRDLMLVPPVPINDESMLSPYAANMAGLGLLAQRHDAWLTQDSLYEPVLDKARREFPDIKNGELQVSLTANSDISEGDIVWRRGYIEILSYGRVFQQACLD